ncbi:aminodeoxychorismate/anthranilate synthase component 2 [Actinomycetota bacterium]|nr:aminodeoxychorismate/anthranilate synthase component 2 [Actinomycetota bacterium]
MVLLIDNYDSFTYNIYQLIGALHPDITVVRNDAIGISEIEVLSPSHIIISPGPGRPEHSGICPKVITHFAGQVPLLGVCLGHQAICQAFGATITYAQTLMHGKVSATELDTESVLFKGLPKTINGARYHSLVADPDTIVAPLRVTASTVSGEVMAVEH